MIFVVCVKHYKSALFQHFNNKRSVRTEKVGRIAIQCFPRVIGQGGSPNMHKVGMGFNDKTFFRNVSYALQQGQWRTQMIKNAEEEHDIPATDVRNRNIRYVKQLCLHFEP